MKKHPVLMMTLLALGLSVLTAEPIPMLMVTDDDGADPLDLLIPMSVPGPAYNQALIDAITARDRIMIKVLLTSMSPEELETDFYIETAVKDCPAEIVEMLINARKTPGSRMAAGDVALNQAVAHRNVGLVRHFLAKGIGDPAWAVVYAAEEGDISMVDLLLEAGADANDALCAAALYGDHGLVLHLLDTKGADANAMDKTADSPALINALQVNPANTSAYWWKDKIETVRVLLRHGADPNKGNPLAKVCATGAWMAPEARIEAISLLLDAGADPNAKDEEGRTPLEALIFYRNYDPENAASYAKAIETLRAAEKDR